MNPILIIPHTDRNLANKELLACTTTIILPFDPGTLESWTDFLTWLQANPEIIAMIVQAILAMLGAARAAQQTE